MARAIHEIQCVAGTALRAPAWAGTPSAGTSMVLIASSSLRDHADAVVGVVEPPSAVVGDGDDVLDPHAEASGQVDAGLHREAHAGNQRLLLGLDHVRTLVGGGPRAVSRAVCCTT